MAGNLIEKSLYGDTAGQPQGNCRNAKSSLEEIPLGEEVATISPTGVALGWRTAFYGCGAAGIFVAIAWYFFATDRPDQHSRVNQSEPEVVDSNRSTVA